MLETQALQSGMSNVLRKKNMCYLQYAGAGGLESGSVGISDERGKNLINSQAGEYVGEVGAGKNLVRE
jgi:hypothetical protein